MVLFMAIAIASEYGIPLGNGIARTVSPMNFLFIVSFSWRVHLVTGGSNLFQVVTSRFRWFQLVPRFSMYTLRSVYLCFFYYSVHVWFQCPVRTVTDLWWFAVISSHSVPVACFYPQWFHQSLDYSWDYGFLNRSSSFWFLLNLV